MTDLEEVAAQNRTIDDELFTLVSTIRPLHYLNPSNTEMQKRAFLGGDLVEPLFEYAPLGYVPTEITTRIERLSIPPGPFEFLYYAQKERLKIANAINQRRGDEEFIRGATLAEFGRPAVEIVAHANDLLVKISVERQAKTVPAFSVRTVLESELATNGLTDWRVEFGNNPQTTVYAAERKITVCEQRLFAADEAQRLAVHEVGVHVLRSANGERQPCRLFALGLPGYLATEEGLAAYAEEICGCLDANTMRNYAGRVLAVDAVHRGLTFRQTFDLLKSKSFDVDSAWDVCVRVFRGGGYLKDHVYLEGYLQVCKFAAEGGELRILYVGKVGLGDLTFVSELLAQGILSLPAHLPRWLGH